MQQYSHQPPPYYAPPPVRPSPWIWVPRVIAVLYGVLSLFCIATFVILGLLFVFNRSTFDAQAGGSLVFPVVMALASLYCVPVTLGLWKLKRLAAVLAVIIHSVLALMFGCAAFMGSPDSSVGVIAVSALIVGALVLPPVRRLYTR